MITGNKKFPYHIGDCSPGQDIMINIYLNRPPSLYVPKVLSSESPTVGEQSYSIINIVDNTKN